MNKSTKLPELAPCRICGAELEFREETGLPEGPYDGKTSALQLIHPDGHPDCWNNNRWYGFRFKPEAREEVVRDFARLWNMHPDFDYFMGGSLSAAWRVRRLHDNLRNDALAIDSTNVCCGMGNYEDRYYVHRKPATWGCELGPVEYRELLRLAKIGLGAETRAGDKEGDKQ